MTKTKAGVQLRRRELSPNLCLDAGYDTPAIRKLLLHRREIERLFGQTAEKAFTVVPTRVYFRGRLAKLELALARGRATIDRCDIRDRKQRREIERALTEAGR